jgi:KDO2-lipid IV(A) lauroyltransferase
MSLIFFIIQLLGYFLPKRIAELVTRGIAHVLFYTVYRNGARNHLENLKVAFGNEKSPLELKKINKNAIYNFAIVLYEHTIMGRLNVRNYQKYLKGEMMENLFNAYNEGNGFIVLSAHLGNYEWGAALMSFNGIPVSVISLEYKTPFIKNLYEKNRNKVGMKVFYIRKAFSGLIRFLRETNGTIAIAGDRNFVETPSIGKLFGKYTELPRGAFYLASKLNIPIVPAFSLKKKDGLYHVYFEKGYKISENEIQKGLDKYISILEKYISKYPEQWYVFERIWKEKS